MILAFLNSTGVLWTENIGCVFRGKHTFSNSRVMWTPGFSVLIVVLRDLVTGCLTSGNDVVRKKLTCKFTQCLQIGVRVRPFHFSLFRLADGFH